MYAVESLTQDTFGCPKYPVFACPCTCTLQTLKSGCYINLSRRQIFFYIFEHLNQAFSHLFPPSLSSFSPPLSPPPLPSPLHKVLLLAMKDMNVAKLTAADLPLFNGITAELFPGIDVPLLDYGIVCMYM